MIDERVREERLVPRCDAAIKAGADAFTAVYDAVYQSVELTEPDGVKREPRSLAMRACLTDTVFSEMRARAGCVEALRHGGAAHEGDRATRKRPARAPDNCHVLGLRACDGL